MKLYDLFYIIKNKQNWNETGDKVNWVISKNTENGKTRILLLFEDSNGNRDWLNNLDFFSSEDFSPFEDFEDLDDDEPTLYFSCFLPCLQSM